jgi:hypothetical protein
MRDDKIAAKTPAPPRLGASRRTNTPAHSPASQRPIDDSSSTRPRPRRISSVWRRLSGVEDPDSSDEIIAGDHAVLQRVFRLLERVADYEGAGVVAFRMQGLGRGDVVVHNRRVCLVIDPAQPHIGKLLRQIDPQVAPLVTSALHRAQERGIGFGEALGRLAESTVEQIRASLCQLSALGIISLAEAHLEDELERYAVTSNGEPVSWGKRFMPARPDYNPSLTFRPIEIYQAAVRVIDTTPPDTASRLFDEFAGSSRLAALFWIDPRREATLLPVNVHGATIRTLADLRKLSYAAHRVCHPPALAAAGVRPEVLLFGPRWNDYICVYGATRMALIHGAGVGERARAANRALTWMPAAKI